MGNLSCWGNRGQDEAKHPKLWLEETDMKSPECNQGMESSCRIEEWMEEPEDQSAALMMVKDDHGDQISNGE